MAAPKLAIWLDCNGSPLNTNAQNNAASKNGAAAVAMQRFRS
jgi:hypothetical protein